MLHRKIEKQSAKQTGRQYKAPDIPRDVYTYPQLVTSQKKTKTRTKPGLHICKQRMRACCDRFMLQLGGIDPRSGAGVR